MTGRFGRNRRRAAIEALAQAEARIAELEAANALLQGHNMRLERQRAYDREEGMNYILAQKHLPHLVEVIGDRLAVELGPHAAKAAVHVLQAGADRRRTSLFELTAQTSFGAAVPFTTLTGRIPELDWRIAIEDPDVGTRFRG